MQKINDFLQEIFVCISQFFFSFNYIAGIAGTEMQFR